MQQLILQVLAGLIPDDMQSVVDEMAGISERTTIMNPVGYARKLARLHREGLLVYEHAPRIQAERRRRQQTESPKPPPDYDLWQGIRKYRPDKAPPMPVRAGNDCQC